MSNAVQLRRHPWNKDKLIGQKSPLRLRDIWAIRVRLQLRNKARDLALFNLAIELHHMSPLAALFKFVTTCYGISAPAGRGVF